jgi:predicted TIM-barrel fold metal-dependent hydrolase
MRIIDFHAHIYPAKIAERATQAISDFYDAPMAFNGSVSELLRSGETIGVERYIVHSTATKSDQVRSINDFIVGETQKEPRFVGFGTLHPDFAETRDELDRITSLGLRGIKLHPDFQRFEIDCAKMDPVYEQIAAAGLPVLVHAGDARYDFSGPKRIARVLDRHPALKLVAAHFGGYTEWDEALESLAGRDLWLDTSSTFWKINPETARRIIEKHGTSRFLFGSDFPMWRHDEELARFLALGLKPSENEAILARNADNLLASIPAAKEF